MTITDISTDRDALRLSVTSELDASVGRAWMLVADPRLLERWWGPPSHPATVVDHDLTPGGRVSYFMTGPEGEKYHGWWEVVAVDAPQRLEVRDGFADDAGAPNPDMPVTRMVISLTPTGNGRAVMVMHSQFASLDAMQKLLEMGMDEGIRQAAGQMDAILAEA